MNSNSARSRADAEAMAKFAAESKARDEQRRQQQAKIDAQPDYIPRGSRSSLVVGNQPTMSVRERAEMAAAQAPEQLTPPRPASATTGTLVNAAPLSVRERQEHQAALARVRHEEAPTSLYSAEANAWYEYEMNRKREDEDKERERERKQAERIAQEQAQAKAQQDFDTRMFPVRLLLDEQFCNDIERQKIWDTAVKHPEFSIDRLYATLLELRRLAAAPKQDWKL